MDSLVIIGSSGHAKVIIDIFENQKQYDIIGLIDDYRNTGDKVLGYNIIGKTSDLHKIKTLNRNCYFFVAIGDNWNRYIVIKRIRDQITNARFANAIHSSVIIGKDVEIGQGVSIMAGCVINTKTIIKDFTIINTSCIVEHDCIIKRNSSLAPGVILGGNVEIGEFSSICIGSIVREKITIGKHSIIGAGSVLLQNCLSNAIMYGSPAKFIRNRVNGEPYLK